jgi:hypothetical protein|uniref:hypothetical protein n=1 Tax=Prosthecobacter sp. TaxID=1965333 RepID=UPI003783412A
MKVKPQQTLTASRQALKPSALSSLSGVPLSRQRVLLADFAAALRQQMFFWGRDVMSGGNLLLRHGFEKLPSPGLKGTSCYRLTHEDGVIELHGACAGWYPQVGSQRPGFLFVRTKGRCTTHRLHEPVVPGRYQIEALQNETSDAMAAARLFAGWLAEYEAWVRQQMGPGYRAECRKMLASLPKGQNWLPAPQAERWLRLFAAQGPGAPRARTLLPGGESNPEKSHRKQNGDSRITPPFFASSRFREASRLAAPFVRQKEAGR